MNPLLWLLVFAAAAAVFLFWVYRNARGTGGRPSVLRAREDLVDRNQNLGPPEMP
jgi:hypothetical protein